MSSPAASTSITFTAAEARRILLAQAMEESRDPILNWSAADAQAANQQTVHALGESPDTKTLLLTRADFVLAELAERGIRPVMALRTRLPWLMGVALALLAFLSGAALDKFTETTRFLNLLSLPYWSVIGWNLAVYLLLALCAAGLVRPWSSRFALPERTLCAWFVKNSAWKTTQNTGWKALFLRKWAATLQPVLQTQVARALHWAAIAFTTGLIVSLLVRGFSTQYSAGWESTWLADDPATVRTFLQWTYGLIPAVGPLPAIPDVDLIAAMRADRLPFLRDAGSAAPWLIRMMLLLALTVIVPRLLFAGFNAWRSHRFLTSLELPLSDPYFVNVLTQCEQTAHLGPMTVLLPETAPDRARVRMQSLAELWNGTPGDGAVATMPADLFADEIRLPEGVQPNETLLLWTDGGATPEDDVQGELIRALAAQAAQAGVLLTVLVDLTRFAERFEGIGTRVHDRTALWNQFLEGLGVHHSVLAASKETDLLTWVRSARVWAASQARLPVTAAKEN